MTIQTADPYELDTDLRAERDKAAGMAVATLLLTAGPRDISITVTRDYAADSEAHDTRVRARVADRALAAEMGDVLGLTGVDVDLGAVWVGHVCGAPTSIVTH